MIAVDKRDQIRSLILGAAVGDALGLPREGLSSHRSLRLFPFPPKPDLLPGAGFFSDDTEHLWMTALACLDARGDCAVFKESLARRLRAWIARLPAGVGFATLRSGVKLWLGARDGVFSAGNGPAMRAPLFGALYPSDRERLRDFNRASTRLTHTDPKAEQGALAVALAAAHALTQPVDSETLTEIWKTELQDAELLDLLNRAVALARAQATEADYLHEFRLERGISGYMYHTVPAALFCWLRAPDYRSSLESVLKLGGDSDTVGAITGALAGLTHGHAAIPAEWLAALKDWPISVERLEHLADALTGAPLQTCDGLTFGAKQLLRNTLFIPVVLAHGFRRLFPPY